MRGYGFQGGAGRDDWHRGAGETAFGAEFKNAISRPGPWRFTFGGYGECLPKHSNYAELDKEKLDAWGIPVLKISCEWSDNERAIVKDMSIAAAEMLSAAGARGIEPFIDNDSPPGFSCHEMGTARMGRDRRPRCSIRGIRRTT